VLLFSPCGDAVGLIHADLTVAQVTLADALVVSVARESKQDLPRALAALRVRLTRDGRILVMITRKTPETKVMIEWWWHAKRYTKHELLQAFREAGCSNLTFRPFPLRYCWLNRANYVIEANA